MPKRFELPVGEPADVALRVFSEEVLYRDSAPVIFEHRPNSVVDEQSVAHLAERVAIIAPELPNGKDVAVEIVIDGERRLLTKAKYEKARDVGVRQDRWSNFFIDRILPPKRNQDRRSD